MKMVLLGFVLMFSTLSYAGPEGQWTHGGDVNIFVVHQDIQKTFKKLSKVPSFMLSSPELYLAFQEAYQSVELRVVERLEWRGQEVTATNTVGVSSLYLNVSRSRWAVLNEDEKQIVILHEFFFLTGIDDTRYEHSAPLHELLVAFEKNDLKTIFLGALQKNRVYEYVDEWESFLKSPAAVVMTGKSTLQYWTVYFQDNTDWLRIFEALLGLVPNRSCNPEMASVYSALIFYPSSSVAQKARTLLDKRGFSRYPDIPGSSYCEEQMVDVLPTVF